MSTSVSSLSLISVSTTSSDSRDTDRSITPLAPVIRSLIKGTFSSETFVRIQDGWEREPSVTETPRIHSDAPAEAKERRIALKRFGKGISKPLLLEIDGHPTAMIKIRQDEVGTDRRELTSKQNIAPRVGCTPGSGAFVELLVNIYLRTLANSLEKLSPLPIIIPGVAYAQMGHAIFADDLRQEDYVSPSSIRGTGLIEEFIPGSSNLTTEQQLNELPPMVLEFLAVADITSLNSDRHSGNLGISKENLVLFDHAYCLSQKGIDGGIFCWKDCKVLKHEPSESIKKFIAGLDESYLANLAHDLHIELKENLDLLDKKEQEGEMQKLELDRILPHQIAVRFLKEAIQHGWTLSQIGNAMHAKPESRGLYRIGGLVSEIYKEIEAFPSEEVQAKIAEICKREAQKRPLASEEGSDAALRNGECDQTSRDLSLQSLAAFSVSESRLNSKERDLSIPSMGAASRDASLHSIGSPVGISH